MYRHVYSTVNVFKSTTGVVQKCNMFTTDETVTLTENGLSFPTSVIKNNNNGSIVHQVDIVLGHGLGMGNPKRTTHKKDNWLPIVSNAILNSHELLSTAVFYTARGHGDCTGWEDVAEQQPDLFTWDSLSLDMINVATKQGLDKFIACGSSMGAATSLFAAINCPERVSAVIMIRPPTGWAERQARRDEIIKSANSLQSSNKAKNIDSKHHLVLEGAALADMPALDDISTYAKIQCPVLILAVRGDPAHPEVSATNIADRVPAELHFVDNFEEACKQWPAIVEEFVVRRLVHATEPVKSDE
jgi:3-oxoadipate enol-lactonase